MSLDAMQRGIFLFVVATFLACTDAGSHCGAFVPGATCTPNNKDVHLLTNVSAELCLTACERQVIVYTLRAQTYINTCTD